MFDLGLVGAALQASPPEISTASGANHVLALNTGVPHAGFPYWMLGSATGTSSGMQIGDPLLPLAFDEYTALTLWQPNKRPRGHFYGKRDATGQALAFFSAPPGELAALAGTTLFHAFAGIDLAFQPFLASNAGSLVLAP